MRRKIIQDSLGWSRELSKLWGTLGTSNLKRWGQAPGRVEFQGSPTPLHHRPPSGGGESSSSQRRGSLATGSSPLGFRRPSLTYTVPGSREIEVEYSLSHHHRRPTIPLSSQSPIPEVSTPTSPTTVPGKPSSSVSRHYPKESEQHEIPYRTSSSRRFSTPAVLHHSHYHPSQLNPSFKKVHSLHHQHEHQQKVHQKKQHSTSRKSSSASVRRRRSSNRIEGELSVSHTESEVSSDEHSFIPETTFSQSSSSSLFHKRQHQHDADDDQNSVDDDIDEYLEYRKQRKKSSVHLHRSSFSRTSSLRSVQYSYQVILSKRKSRKRERERENPFSMKF